MDKSRLAEIEARAEKAMEGPFQVHGLAALADWAHVDIPALLSALKESEARREELEAAVRRLRDAHEKREEVYSYESESTDRDEAMADANFAIAVRAVTDLAKDTPCT